MTLSLSTATNAAPAPSSTSTLANGNITTVTGGNGQSSDDNQLQSPSALGLDSDDNLYIVDTGNHRVQRIRLDASGNVTDTTTVAGGNGAGSNANQLNSPNGWALGHNDTLFIVDTFNHRIQKLTLDGNGDTATITTVAGGNGVGPATNQFANPLGMAIDSSGTLNIADSNNHRIQRITLYIVNPTITDAIDVTTKVGTTKTINYTCTDTGSGINTCTATLNGQTVNNGDPLNTTKRGTHTLTTTAIDQEFHTLYGNTSNAEFVDLMYLNVMGRTPGTKAKAFGLKDLDTGHRTRAQILLWFAESTEFKTLTHTS